MTPACRAALLGVLTTACTPFALSPPSRTLPLESPATLREGRVALQAAAGSTFDDTETAAVRARAGLTPDIEVQLEGSYLHHEYGDERGPDLGAGRVGVKLAPTPHVAFALGLGAGSHTHGAFVAPDVGLLAGYENPDVVLWGAARFALSVPAYPRTVVVTHEVSDRVERVSLTPYETLVTQLSTGVRIPVPIAAPPVESVSLLGGVAWTHLHGIAIDRDIWFLHGEIGLEIVLDTHQIEDPNRLLFEERDE
jgi:hypothetical protein